MHVFCEFRQSFIQALLGLFFSIWELVDSFFLHISKFKKILMVRDVKRIQFLSDFIAILTGSRSWQLRICADGERVKVFWFSEGRKKV